MAPAQRREYTFDLETAIATWRQFLSRDASVTAEDLEELEDHLRDEIAALKKTGRTDEEAFRAAIKQVGDLAALTDGFNDVRMEKRLAPGRRGDELRGSAALVGSYFRTALRGVVRHRGYALLNISGLAVALAACLVIGIFIYHSLSYDRWFKDADRIVRVEWVMSNGEILAGLPPGIATALETDFPEVTLATSYVGARNREMLLTADEQHFQVDRFVAADSEFFDVFSYELLRGDLQNPLGVPNSVVLNTSTARRLFGDEDPIGRTVTVSARTDYTVTAVAADPPTATFLDFNFVLSAPRRSQSIDWSALSNGAFVKLGRQTSPSQFERHLNEYLENASPEQWGYGCRFMVEPLTRIHLHSKASNRYGPSSDVRYLYLFGGIGLLVLLMASINYMNLATARSARRAREVGVRKVVGASRAQLARQFFGESLLMVLLALPPAAALAALALPWISNMTGVELTLAMANHGWVWAGMILLLFAEALVAGSYPSLVLSGFRPARVFSGGRSAGAGHALVRKLLVGTQVVATFALILGSFLFLRQMDYVRSKRLGFDQEQVVTLPRLSGWDRARYNAFKQAAESDPSVLDLTFGEALGTDRRHSWGNTSLVPNGPKYPIVSFIVGRDFIETMGLQLLAGESFRAYDGTGRLKRSIVTESYARALEPNGDVVGYTSAGTRDTTQIVGVVADFQNRSLHSLSSTEESGTLYTFELTDFDEYGVSIPLARLAPGRTAEGLRALKTAWDRLSPERPFQFEFLDDLIQAQYTSERRLASLFGVFAGLSILIACLGLFGLAAFSAEQRTKEIGIRKALGATARGIVLLLSRDYVAIVLAGVVVAIPLVLILGSEWLQNFSDHISIGPGLLLSATAVVLGFVLLAVGYQSVKVAISNPTDALRHE